MNSTRSTCDVRERAVAFVKALSGSRPKHARFGSCAVVGSAPSVLDARLGNCIDAHDAVFRVNDAPTAGFEEFVGTKTTWRVITELTPGVHVHARPNSTDALLPVQADELLLYCGQSWVGRCHQAALAWRTSVSLINPSLVHATYALINTLSNAVAKRSARIPTAGMMAVIAALKSCERVSLAGFSSSGNMSSGSINASLRSCANYYPEQEHQLLRHTSVRRRQQARTRPCRQREEYFAFGSYYHDFGQQQRAITRLEQAGAVRILERHDVCDRERASCDWRGFGRRAA